MIDEATLELLSRHLDGDLTPLERGLLEGRLATEPALAAELAGLERVRDGLRALASRDHPPADLDAALEPLRRSAPPTLGLRPAYRWLALAATLLVGATVTFRVAQRAPAPRAESPTPTRQLREASDTPYQLRPLPTSAVPEDQQPLGAVDRLLASPPPTPVLPESPVHTAIGPLTERERKLTAPPAVEPQPQRSARDRVAAKAQAPPRVEEVAAAASTVAGDAQGEAEEVVRLAGASRASADGASPPAPASVAGRLESRSQAVAPRSVTVTLSTPAGPLVIRVGTRLVGGVPERPAQVSIRDGAIVAVRSPATNEVPALPDILVHDLTGVSVGAVADGEYEAVIGVN